MDKLTKSILLAGVVFSLQLMDCYKGSLVLGQNVVQRTEVVRTQVSTDSAQIMQVTLKSLSASADKSALESIQNILQNIEGVIYRFAQFNKVIKESNVNALPVNMSISMVPFGNAYQLQ
ncbi:MAG: hypothetical protein ACE5HO_01200 [bacterium]